MENSTLCIFATIFSLVGITGLFSVLYTWETQDTLIRKYSLVFDAGSSHTKLFIYTWAGAKLNETAIIKQIASFENSNPGISHFKDNPSQAAKSLEPYMEFAKDMVPKIEIPHTPVYLGATAGMRMLRQSNQSASNAIFESIRNLFKKSGFQINNPIYQVRILSGEEEGAFSWITVNYLKGNVEKNGAPALPHILETSSTIGALDMGGASTQITFIPDSNYSIPENFTYRFSLYNHPLKVYTHSFLCYGVNEIIRKYHAVLAKASNGTTTNISSPCWLKGSSKNDSSDNIFKTPCTFDPTYSNVSMYYHFVGTANHTECQRIIDTLFDFKNCPYKGCSFNKIYQPPVKNKSFMAFSIYYYIMKSLNLTKKSDNFSLKTYNNAVYSWCNKTWKEARQTPGYSEAILSMMCIEAIYIKTILTKGYGFDNTSWNSLHFNMTVKGCEVGWTMGFMMYISNSIPALIGEQLSLMSFSLLLVLFATFIVFAILFATLAIEQGPDTIENA